MILSDLRLKEYDLRTQADKIYNEIDQILEKPVVYKGIKCIVTDFDLEANYINIYPMDGETPLVNGNRNLDITFESYDELFKKYKYKIHFYKGMEAFGQVLEHFKTVEVELESKPTSDNEVITEGLKIIGSYPKSYTAKVYEIK
ncbi:hypothetical protein [Bacillus sp. FJAT-22090]|uniref:hypothetical protein n=1 Tax=Bacillus sp. FJAT-22090 TaxID=1581038 RepID=UPI00119DE200|nr:hypothetical protein [Bacillus sp. FJAT-22090]